MTRKLQKALKKKHVRRPLKQMKPCYAIYFVIAILPVDIAIVKTCNDSNILELGVVLNRTT